MNQRIKELVKQVAPSFGENQKWAIVGETDIEKFAELIVRECIGCCGQVISDPVPKSVDTWLNGGLQCIEEIKQHFGVEE